MPRYLQKRAPAFYSAMLVFMNHDYIPRYLGSTCAATNLGADWARGEGLAEFEEVLPWGDGIHAPFLRDRSYEALEKWREPVESSILTLLELSKRNTAGIEAKHPHPPTPASWSFDALENTAWFLHRAIRLEILFYTPHSSMRRYTELLRDRVGLN